MKYACGSGEFGARKRSHLFLSFSPGILTPLEQGSVFGRGVATQQQRFSSANGCTDARVIGVGSATGEHDLLHWERNELFQAGGQLVARRVALRSDVAVSGCRI
jgi:hypothetical protein